MESRHESAKLPNANGRAVGRTGLDRTEVGKPLEFAKVAKVANLPAAAV